MYGESNMETYNSICKLESQWEFALWLREVKQGVCDDLEGLEGEEDGREHLLFSLVSYPGIFISP